jgi:hypothetical protein
MQFCRLSRLIFFGAWCACPSAVYIIQALDFWVCLTGTQSDHQALSPFILSSVSQARSEAHAHESLSVLACVFQNMTMASSACQCIAQTVLVATCFSVSVQESKA